MCVFNVWRVKSLLFVVKDGYYVAPFFGHKRHCKLCERVKLYQRRPQQKHNSFRPLSSNYMSSARNLLDICIYIL